MLEIKDDDLKNVWEGDKAKENKYQMYITLTLLAEYDLDLCSSKMSSSLKLVYQSWHNVHKQYVSIFTSSWVSMFYI